MDIPDYMKAEEIRIVILEDENLSVLAEHIIHGWLSTKAEVHKELKQYWSFRGEIAIIDGTSIKGKIVIIPASLQDNTLKQLHINLMGIEKNKNIGTQVNILDQHECQHRRNN